MGRTHIFTYDALESTSTEAERLAKTTALPFAVHAATQTAGRGRMGAKWESPRGNLYLTVALSPEGNPRLWTARAGMLVARYLEGRFGICVTQKWPNDLFFRGRKLCGILCESQSQGQEFGPVLVGIGVNVNHAPAVSAYQTICLTEITGELIDVHNFASELADALVNGWNSPESANDSPDDSTYAIRPGHVFLESTHGWMRSEDLIDGVLGLRSLLSGERLRAVSAHESLRWFFQFHGLPHPALVADLGNTRIKFGVAARAGTAGIRIVEQAAVSYADQNECRAECGRLLMSFAERFALPSGWPVFTVSVQPERERFWRDITTRAGLAVHFLTTRPVRALSSYDLARIGQDRWAAVEAAASLGDGAVPPTVVVSAGTALTIDVLAKSEGKLRHLGGWILPGRRLAAESLAQHTGQLPLVSDAPTSSITVGVDTVGAISQGIGASHIGAVREAMHWLAAASQIDVKDVRVIVTGGDGAELAGSLGALYREDLILLGAAVLAEAGA